MTIKVQGDTSNFHHRRWQRTLANCGRLPFPIAGIRAARATCILLKGLIALIQISEGCKFAGVY